MSHLRTVVATAAITCASVLAFAWPTVTQATGPETSTPSKATIDPDAAEVGPVLASSKLVPHPKFQGVYNLEVAFKNPSAETPCEAKLEAVVYAQAFSMDSRGGPMPTVAWKTSERVRLGPDEVVARTYTLPAALSLRVSQSIAAAKKAEATGDYPSRGVSYYAEVVDPTPPNEQGS
ncbi:MAG: hypothetical protein JW751_24140 [Polyangiaceae bacterium]|nr:hypothetical protein [Polyangiaceae bacterium]